MKKLILTIAASLGALSAGTVLAQDWSSYVNIAAINMTPNGDFIIVAPNAPNPGSCNGYYRAYVNYMGVTTFGIEMLHKQAIVALVSGKKVSIFRSNDAYCYVGYIQLNSN